MGFVLLITALHGSSSFCFLSEVCWDSIINHVVLFFSSPALIWVCKYNAATKAFWQSVKNRYHQMIWWFISSSNEAVLLWGFVQNTWWMLSQGFIVFREKEGVEREHLSSAHEGVLQLSKQWDCLQLWCMCFFSYSLKNWLQWISPSASQLVSHVKNLL